MLQALGVAMAPADPLGSATDSGVGEERRPGARGGGVGRRAHEKAWLRFESEVEGRRRTASAMERLSWLGIARLGPTPQRGRSRPAPSSPSPRRDPTRGMAGLWCRRGDDGESEAEQWG